MEGNMGAVQIDAVNSSEVLETVFNWQIPKIDLDKKIYTEKIVLTKDMECTLMLIPKLVNFPMQDKIVGTFLTVFFTKAPNDEQKKTLFRISAQSLYSGEVVAYQDFKKVALTTEGFQADENFMTSNNRKRFLDRNHNLNMEITFTLMDPDRFKSLSLRNFEQERTNLAKSYAKIYNDKDSADIKLICAKNEEVPAHKAILAARSPVFAKILTDQVNTYDIGGVCKKAVLEFLRFLYCDTLNTAVFDNHSVDIWQLAIKFEVDELMQLAMQDIFFGTQRKMHLIHQKITDLSQDQAKKTQKFYEIAKSVTDLYELAKVL